MTERTSREIPVTERQFLWVEQMIELSDSQAASKRLVDAAELETQRNLRELEVMAIQGTILAEVLGGKPALPALQALRAKFSAKVEGEEKAP